MSKAFRFGSALSMVAASAMLAGCATSQQTAGAAHFGGSTDDDLGLATRALAALNAKDNANAVSLAERAVARTPDDAGIRALLGNAYFASGRFASAEAAFRDSLTIYSNQPQVVLKLALAEIALGKTHMAVQVLEAGRSVLDAADFGLAMALAGQPGEAIEVLGAAARETVADSRVRQNLALAYALNGDWTQARTVAAQDVPANQVDARIRQWMLFANPAKKSDQVASLIGVKPAAQDVGQPVRLALSQTNTQLAKAEPVRVPVAPQPAPVTVDPVAFAAASRPAPVAVAIPAPPPFPTFAEAGPASTPVEPVAVPAQQAPAVIEAAAAAPATSALLAAAETVRATITAIIPHKAAAPAAKPRKAVRPPMQLAAARSGPVVQLGAYGSPGRVNAAWTSLSQRYPALRAYLPMRAQFDSSKGKVWRLSVGGFGSQREAMARCQQLRSSGGNCFVRGFAGDAPVQYASR